MKSTFVSKHLSYLLSLLMAATLSAAKANAQLNSTAQSVTLNATLGETLTISATPANVSFALVNGGVAVGSAPVAITTTWLLAPTRANLVLDGFFSSSSAALTDGASTPDNIPTSAVLGKVSTGTPTAYTAFTQTTALGPAGAGLTLYTLPLTSANRSSTRTDNLNLEINLSGLPQLPAGSYTGILTLQAQAL
jgi:hypothetical protein